MQHHSCAECGYARNTRVGLRQGECNCHPRKQQRVKYSGDCGCGCGGILGEKQCTTGPLANAPPVAAYLDGIVPKQAEVGGRLKGGPSGDTGQPLRASTVSLDFETVGRYSVVDSADAALANSAAKWAQAGLHRGRLVEGGGNGSHN